MDGEQKRQSCGSALATAEHKLRIQVVANRQVQGASEVACKSVINCAPIGMWPQPLIELHEQGAYHRQTLINYLAKYRSNRAANHLGSFGSNFARHRSLASLVSRAPDLSNLRFLGS